MSNLPAYRKTIAAIVGAVITWGATAQDDGIQAVEWWGLAAALATVLGVYGVANEPAPDDGDGGQGTVDVVIKVLLVLILVVFLLALFRRT
jgi:hypothetical protein